MAPEVSVRSPNTSWFMMDRIQAESGPLSKISERKVDGKRLASVGDFILQVEVALLHTHVLLFLQIAMSTL